MSALRTKKLAVKKSVLHGMGVFAGEDIAPQEIIEECHLLFPKCIDLYLNDYLFQVGDTSGLPLGYGAIYNHATESNASYAYDPERQCLIFTAKQWIKKGDEIVICYGDDWFSERNVKPNKLPFRYHCKRILKNYVFLLRFLVVFALLVGLKFLA